MSRFEGKGRGITIHPGSAGPEKYPPLFVNSPPSARTLDLVKVSAQCAAEMSPSGTCQRPDENCRQLATTFSGHLRPPDGIKSSASIFIFLKSCVPLTPHCFSTGKAESLMVRFVKSCYEPPFAE
jgi:hypothetical protein